ncbi:sensor histidine kinase [Dactylosporangium sp. CA-233914]|uniref:sensor histidine kinase n=1 Tax=Dactylosporangium sp. CA-233914 TaxID=3239934 RepID=UPI003D9504F4
MTSWQALRLPPWRLLTSGWPWRALAYQLSGVICAAVALAAATLLAATGVVLSPTLVGVPVLIALALLGLPVAAVERRRLLLVDREPLASPHGVPQRAGLRGWLGTRLREPATWRELAYTLLVAVLLPVELLVTVYAVVSPLLLVAAWPLLVNSPPDATIQGYPGWVIATEPQAWAALPIGLMVAVVAVYLLLAITGLHATLARTLLAPREEELRARVAELSRSRSRLVEAFDAERRRIERDLHDGAQQRLVVLTMTLGLARTELPEPGGVLSSSARDLVVRAHDEAKRTLSELRELIHGIHPRVLTDHGLPAAVEELADQLGIPVTVELPVPRRLPPAVEAAAYFVVREALANIVRHSRARHASVTGQVVSGRLMLTVQDDGVGGADPQRGTGIVGLADRVSTVGGRLVLTSPPGGPTTLTVELPCDQTETTSVGE